MPGLTNKGKAFLFDLVRGASVPTNYYIALVTSATAPDADTNLMSDLTEITAGNGYTSGGFQLTPNSTDFDSLVENDANDRGECQIKDVVWTASGGPIPASGYARYAVLTDDNGTVANREVYFFWDLLADKSAADGTNFSLIDLEFWGVES